MRSILALLLLAAGAHAQDGAFGFGFAYWVVTDGQPVVSAVAPGGAAEAAGLVPGDSLLQADDEVLVGLTANEVGEALDVARADDPAVTFVLVRDGEQRTIRIEQAPYDPGDVMRRSRTFYCRKGNCLDGVGVWQAPDGERYEGPFVDGWRHGEGTLVLANRDLYVGSFFRGAIDGVGTYVWADGGHYAGEIRNRRPEGRGLRVYADGALYTGKFADGLPHGGGTHRRADGSFWTGVWEDGAGVRGTDHATDGTVRGMGPFEE